MNKPPGELFKYALRLVCWLVVTVAFLPLAILLTSLGSILHYLAERVNLLFEWLVHWKGEFAPFPLTDAQKERVKWLADEDL